MLENDVITKRINYHYLDGDPADAEARLVYSQMRNEATLTEHQPLAIIARVIQKCSTYNAIKSSKDWMNYYNHSDRCTTLLKSVSCNLMTTALITLSKLGKGVSTPVRIINIMLTGDDYDNSGYERCDYVENLVSNGCQRKYLVNPGNKEKYIKNVAPHDSEHGADAVQLAPQEVEVTIRPNRAYTLDVTFRQAKDYPVDLYYVMDLSNTMLKSKKQVANLGNELAIQMRNITANFRLGFGSYIDKKTSPYTSIVPARLEDPCRTTVCAPTYSFKNHLPLTSDAQQFTDRIGWRSVSRKILLVSTDNIYHYAGDGKDYPSVSHLAYRVSEENVNIIFAIIDRLKAMATYKPLTSLIRAAVVVKLEEDSANIVDVIKDNYKRISGKVELRHNAPSGVEVSYATSCLGHVITNGSTCDGLKVRDSVTFRITLNLTGCPTDVEDHQKTVVIYPVGLSDKLELRLNVDCSCPCENPDFEPVGEITAPVRFLLRGKNPKFKEPNSMMCDDSGTYQCGVCSCDPGTYGKNCMCHTGMDRMCRRTATSEICEGRGICDCGQCLCDQLSATDTNKRYTGMFCECDDYSCDSHAGKLCGGQERGQCVCGKCYCRDAFTGPSCNCSMSTATCISANELICSGHGRCICGVCHCDEKYQGRVCDICQSCPGQCEMNKACVQCSTFGTGPYSEAECAANCSYVNTVELISKECPKAVNKFGIILGVVGVITVIGIILLIIWKVIVTIYDRREYEKFVREREAAKWQVEGNPIYKPSTSTFRNPTFDKAK
ncbi:hypothetical protein LSH36_200g04066 [Paralvinella palmiformis]|uniref:Integrin beta n=1 Tax=Paralvinella palmiformis TaxID=53620 RepID=A0AAD9JQH1_9ANNE|nr:hypothetical protein LSH36_200g04066 [Paralvinella palmiformis]